jgi:hypothetical protein
MKILVKNLTVGLLVVLLANVGILVVDQDVAMAASCNLHSSTDPWGNTSTSGYCNGNRVSTYSSTDPWGNTSSSNSLSNCWLDC